MRVINFNYPKNITRNKPMVIYVFSDLHIGNIGFNEHLLKKHINMCKKEDAYSLLLGDLIEGIAPDDKRFDIRFATNPILEQYKLVEDMFTPIADKCLGILAGNHDEKVSAKYGDNVAMMCKRLDIPYLGYEGFINILMKHSNTKTPQHTFTIYAHHGYGGGRTDGATLNKLVSLSHSFDADLYLMGHLHKSITHHDAFLTQIKSKRNRWQMFKRIRFYAACHSYLESYKDEVETYASKLAYKPQPIGCIRIELYRAEDNIMAHTQPISKGM